VRSLHSLVISDLHFVDGSAGKQGVKFLAFQKCVLTTYRILGDTELSERGRALAAW
jgi:hypothetical protein